MTHRFTDRDGVDWIVEWHPAKKGGERSGLSFFAARVPSFFVPMSKVDPGELTVGELQAMVDNRSREASET